MGRIKDGGLYIYRLTRILGRAIKIVYEPNVVEILERISRIVWGC